MITQKHLIPICPLHENVFISILTNAVKYKKYVYKLFFRLIKINWILSNSQLSQMIIIFFTFLGLKYFVNIFLLKNGGDRNMKTLIKYTWNCLYNFRLAQYIPGYFSEFLDQVTKLDSLQPVWNKQHIHVEGSFL